MGMILEILVGSPVTIPPSVHQNSLSAKVAVVEAVRTDRGYIVIEAYDKTFHSGKLFEGKFRNVDPIRVSVKGTVDVRAGVGDHLDLSDLKFSTRLVSIA